MKKYRKKLSEVTNMGYRTLADDFDFDGVNEKLSQVDGMEFVSHLSSKKSTVLKGNGAVSLKIEDINESVAQITEGMNGLFEKM
jgi:methylase of polypeptide subunit release factors